MVFIDALRGLAALAIAAHHIDRYGPLCKPAAKLLPRWAVIAADNARISVQVFLVISGFVIAYSLCQTKVTPRVAGNFMLRRVVRLGVPYWTIVALVFALHLVASALGWPSPIDYQPTWRELAANMLCLQDILEYEGFSAGQWFVGIELQFSMLFIALWAAAQWIESKQTLHHTLPRYNDCPALLAVFAPLALCSQFYFNLDSQYDPWVIYFFASFFLGSLAWWALEKRIPGFVFWFFVLAGLIKIGLVYKLHGGWDLRTALSIAACSAIYLVGRLNRLDRWLSARWLQYLGRISYSFFLVHYAVNYAISEAGHRLTGDSPAAAVAWMAAAALGSLAAAHVFYVLVEAPSMRLSARMKIRGAEERG
jgi:peptidoglycan/LPS O-acetylase OafA/YrhL